jgi:hypothetical protein
MCGGYGVGVGVAQHDSRVWPRHAGRSPAPPLNSEVRYCWLWKHHCSPPPAHLTQTSHSAAQRRQQQYLVWVLHHWRLEAVEGHEGDAAALATVELGSQAQRHLIVLHLQAQCTAREAGKGHLYCRLLHGKVRRDKTA